MKRKKERKPMVNKKPEKDGGVPVQQISKAANNKKDIQPKITSFFKAPPTKTPIDNTYTIQDNNNNNKEVDKKQWRLGTLNINNQYKLFKSEIEFVLINDIKIDILALQEIGIKDYDINNRFLKIKPKEYDTILLHCKKNLENKAAETSLALIINKAVCSGYNANKYPHMRAITISTDKLLIINIYISAQEGEYKRKQFEWLCRKRYNAKKKGKEVIIMGDMNSIQNETLDRMSNTVRKTPISVKHINQLLNAALMLG